MRGVIAGGIARVGRLRRQRGQESSHTPAEPRGTVAPPAPRRPRLPRRPSAAAPVPPPRRPGWFARWFGPRRCQPASPARPALPGSDDAAFTPDAWPGLSPEARAFFNTPVEDCDPEILRLLLAALAGHIADAMAGELGMDAKALFSTLCSRLAPALGETRPDAPPAAEAAQAPTTPEHAAPDAAATPPIQAQGTEPVDAATAVAATRNTGPDGIFAPAPVFRRDRRLVHAGRPFRHRRRPPVDRGRLGFHRFLPGTPRALPPPQRLCYAACAGPP